MRTFAELTGFPLGPDRWVGVVGVVGVVAERAHGVDVLPLPTRAAVVGRVGSEVEPEPDLSEAAGAGVDADIRRVPDRTGRELDVVESQHLGVDAEPGRIAPVALEAIGPGLDVPLEGPRVKRRRLPAVRGPPAAIWRLATIEDREVILHPTLGLDAERGGAAVPRYRPVARTRVDWLWRPSAAAVLDLEAHVVLGSDPVAVLPELPDAVVRTLASRCRDRVVGVGREGVRRPRVHGAGDGDERVRTVQIAVLVPDHVAAALEELPGVELDCE